MMLINDYKVSIVVTKIYAWSNIAQIYSTFNSFQTKKLRKVTIISIFMPFFFTR